MGKKAALSSDDKRKLRFAAICSTARSRICAGTVPDYLGEALPEEVLGRLMQEAGLAPSCQAALLERAVALDLALSSPDRPNPKTIRREISSVFRTVDKLLDQLDRLSPDALSTIWGPYVQVAAGDVQVAAGKIKTLEASQKHVWDQLSAALSQTQKARKAIDIDGGSAGPGLSAVALAAEAVIGLVEEQGLQLSPTQLVQRIDDLFYGIRLHHGRLSRPGDRDHDEVPRTRDLVVRILERRSRGAHNRA